MPVSVGAAIALSILAGLAALGTAAWNARSDRWAEHSLVVRREASELLSDVTEAEAGQRGYLLTGDPSYLAPYLAARDRLGPLESRIRTQVADNPAQLTRAASLYSLIGAKLDELGRTVALARQGRQADAAALVKTNAGRDLMGAIRSGLTAFDATEAGLHTERQRKADRARAFLLLVLLICLAIAVALGALVVRAGRRHAGELRQRNAALREEMERRRDAEARLRQAERMEALGQLTGGVAHDFNNLLAVILGNLDMLRRRLEGQEEKTRRLAQGAYEGADRAAELTRRLLAYSRRQPLEPSSVDVNAAVASMSELLRRTLGETIAIETVLGGGLWAAFVDRPQLESLILNLAANARDAMPAGGRLTVETANAWLDAAYAEANADVAPGQYVLIAITDTGAGMAPEVMERAFDPFYTTKPTGRGTGLGLSQVHGFVKQSRGHIKLYSEAGAGTSVKIYLPRDARGAAGQAAPAAPLAANQARPLKVLVVEDDAAVRAMAVSAVRDLGHAVVEADCGAIALERLEQQPDIAVMLTDVIMPGMNGKKLADAAAVKWPAIKVLFMTGYTQNAIVHNGMLDPGTRLITKPFTIEQLDRALRQLAA
ncbi:MAG TPA: CHASE3 domain-containing protein [Caulobacteraceae bacterium]|jgi:signal transduction histidine kinase